MDELSEVLEKLGAKDWMGDRLGFAQRKKKNLLGGGISGCVVLDVLYIYV